MKADHNTITLFGVEVMSKYKVLSKGERGVIKLYYICDSSICDGYGFTLMNIPAMNVKEMQDIIDN